MKSTFLQKVVLCAIAGFTFALLIQFYKTFIEGADNAINGAYKTKHISK